MAYCQVLRCVALALRPAAFVFWIERESHACYVRVVNLAAANNTICAANRVVRRPQASRAERART